ncbi:5-methylcytosine restriction system specificity protein McrC [Helicobacter cinaedi]|uniref:5-methylcytosine restriction system specificity protein McrC n=1 Tax=Helicobacter cinaedi TaxID=213 RepID=UPI000D7CF8E4|nr:hypothetical protein [Helicobacter cinaedi]
MPTLHIAEYQSFGLEDIQKILESCKIKDFKQKAQKIFQELKDFASDEKHNHFLAYKTKNTLKAKNYVGTIQTKSGFCIDILPKTFNGEKIQDSKKCECKEKIKKDFECFSDGINSITDKNLYKVSRNQIT